MDKRNIRLLMNGYKKNFSIEERKSLSNILFEKLEMNEKFLLAKNILVYHSLPDEVCTHNFIEKWSKHKRIFLPVVVKDLLVIREYTGNSCLITGKYNILEPEGDDFLNISDIDFAIIPGVSFDLDGNRLGRGKGYYDKLLCRMSSYKVGVCFDFQIYKDGIPTDAHDIKMDEVWTENGRVY